MYTYIVYVYVYWLGFQLHSIAAYYRWIYRDIVAYCGIFNQALYPVSARGRITKHLLLRALPLD